MNQRAEVDRRRTSSMLHPVSRFALLFSSAAFVGCSVPTPVGELQQDAQGSNATSTTLGPDEESLSSGSSTASDPTGSSTASLTGSSSGGAVVADMTSFAIRRGDLPDLDPTETSDTFGSGVGTGSEGDPDDLLITFGFTAASCQDPNASDPCQTWTATLVLSPAQQTTGTYTDAEVDGFFFEQGDPEPDGSCPGTGGTLTGFTIIVESIDDDIVELVFEGDGIGPSTVDLNGMSFSIPRC